MIRKHISFMTLKQPPIFYWMFSMSSHTSNCYTEVINEYQPDHAFRAEVPNIVTEMGLSLPALGLYTYLKRIAGDGGACFKTQTNICKDVGVSPATYIKYRDELASAHDLINGKSLVRVTVRKKSDGSNDTTTITMVDVWRENGDYFRAKNNNRGHSKSERPPIQNLNEVIQNLNGEEEPLKKNPKEQQQPSAEEPASPGCCSSFSKESLNSLNGLPLSENEARSIACDFELMPAGKFKAAIEAYKQYVANTSVESHAAVIRKALKEGWTPNTDRKAKAAEEARSAQELEDKHHEIGYYLATRVHFQGATMRHHGQYLEVKLDQWPIHQCFKYADTSWKVQIDNVLRKVGSSLEVATTRKKTIN